jgi:phospho-N-acetylmuramoyl-pentapeptide-transferase
MFLITDLLLLMFSALLASILYPFWIKFIYAFNIEEEARHVSKIGTPTMGGLVFVFVVAFVTFAFNRSRTQTLFPLFVASLAGLLGILEDFTKVYRKSGFAGFFEYYGEIFGKFFRLKKRKTIRTRFTDILFKPWNLFKEAFRIVGSSDTSGIKTYQKFIVQGLIGGFVSYWTYFKLGWDYFWLPLVGDVHVGWLYPILIFFFFLMVLNFVGFSDGLDGLAGGLALFAFIAFWVISGVFEYNSLAAFCATFVGALIPFLYFNIYPARVFMGNVGSHALGAVLAVLAVVLHREIAFLVISLPFLIDGISSPIQSISYKMTKRRVFKMAPLHHHFERIGWPETKVTFRFWLFGIFSAFLGVFVALL